MQETCTKDLTKDRNYSIPLIKRKFTLQQLVEKEGRYKKGGIALLVGEASTLDHCPVEIAWPKTSRR